MDCVQAKGRTRAHKKKTANQEDKIGIVAADIAVFSKEGPFVIVMVAKNDNLQNVYHAVTLSDKSKESITQMVMDGMLTLEILYNIKPLKRVHSDQESGLMAAKKEIQLETGAIVTSAAAHDPQANG